METELKGLVTATRAEIALDSGLTYDGTRRVQLHVSKREGRYKVSDEGAAVSAAGSPEDVTYPEQLVFGDHSVNVTRKGIVWLPAVAPSDEWLAKVCELVATGSVALYERLLDLDESA